MKRRAFLKSVSGAVAMSALSRVQAQSPAEFDFIVIGAGSSGCVLANRLSADPSHRVLVIEAGGRGDESVAAPARWVSLIGSPFDWNYETEPTATLGGRVLRWPRGKVLGGSSAINAMAYVRGHRLSFDAWAAAAGPEWSYQRVLPIFKQLEDNSRGASEFLGAGGPLAVADTTDPHAAHLAFLEGARELGYAASPTWDFNGAQQENGAGFYQKNIRGGRRHSAADAFLLPALQRKNLTVWTGASARRLVMTSGRVTEVEVLRDGGRIERVRVAREVVLAAGVIESPKLLMLSGIGPAAALERLGIPVRVDAPDVGANLHDHPRVSLRWASQRPLAGSSVSAGLFVHSRAGRSKSEAAGSAPDLQFYVGRGLDTVDEFVTLTVALCVPRSRGSIVLRSSEPEARPEIRTGYFTEPADIDALAEGVRLARALAETKPYATLRGSAIDPKPDEQSPDAIRAYIRRAADTIFHPAGTCRMGNDARSVVDPTLRVRGVSNLRVADGAVMPVSVNAQTHAACLLIGTKAADFILR